MLKIGDILDGRYRIDHLLGEGGMAWVFRARQIHLNRDVALKVLKRSPYETDAEKRHLTILSNEGSLLAGLTHSGLANILDFSGPSEQPYLVMEYIDGHTLSEILEIAGGYLHQEQVLHFLAEILETLDYLHTRTPPVIVRDLKPDNIMCDKAGRVKLIDFGISRTLELGSETGTMIRGLGSEGFSPLEQYGAGPTQTVSDIYSLGATLYFLLSGNTPPGAIRRVTENVQLADLSLKNVTVSSEFRELIERMMNVLPADRPTAQEVRMLLASSRWGKPSSLSGQRSNARTSPGTKALSFETKAIASQSDPDGGYGQHTPRVDKDEWLLDDARRDQWLETAHAYANQGRWDEAIEAFQEALKSDPHDLDVRGYIISLSLKSGNYSEVIHQHMECAEIFRQQEDLDAAVDRYREVLRLEETIETQGSSLRSADELAQVKESVKRVKPEVCLQIGRFFLLRNEVDIAVQYIRKSIELGPGRWESHMSLGRAYMQLGMDREAIDQFQEVSRLAPQEAAHAYEMLGEIFARKKGRSVQNTKVWFQHAAEMYIKKNLLGDATRAYLRILDLEPENREILHSLGELYAKQERLAEAVETYRALAGLYADNKPLDKVIGLYEKVVSLDSSARWAIDALIDIYESVLEREPSNEKVRERLKKLATAL